MKKDYIVELREEEADELIDDHWVGELVRCKDCKHGEKCNEIYLCGKARGFGIAHDPSWFCADGEHK